MADRYEIERDTLEIHLEPPASRSARSAFVSAVVGAGGGPLYQFVAAAAHLGSLHSEDVAVRPPFPLEPFQHLDVQTDIEWTVLTRKRLQEFDTELHEQGWRRIPEQGDHWRSFGYVR